MAFEVGAIVSKLELKKDQWNQSIKKVKEDQKSLSGLVLRNSQSFAKMGRAMTVAGGIIVGSIGLMVKAYANFDQAMTESLAIMGDISDETRKKMSDMAKTMSEETTFSAKELAEAYFFLASAGMDASQSITVLGDVARFAQAGAFDLSTATDLLTDAQTALGLSSKDAIKNQENLIRVSDVLVGANTLANASVKQFAESLTNKASAALVNVNKEVEEGVAVLAAYADKGVKGSLAGQRLTMMLNGLFDASRKNTKAWDEAGISLFEADGSMRSIADIIQDLEGYLGSMTVKQREAALAQLGFNLRTKDSILTLMGSSEKIRKWTEDLKNMGGKTKEVSDKQLETFNNQLKLLKNTVTNAAISIGESLAPMIGDLVVKIKEVAKSVSDWIKEHPKLTAVIAKTALKVGALLTVLGPLVMMLPGIAKGFMLLKLSFTSMLGPIGLVTAGLGFITIEVIKANKHFKNLTATISEFSEKSGEKISWFKKTLWSLDETYRKFTTGISNSEIVARKMREEIGKLDKKHAEYGKKVWDSIEGTEGFSKASEFLNKLLGKQKGIIEEDTEATEDHGKATERAAKETKTWIDYIKDIGIKTVKEKRDRIKELGGYVDGLSRAYAAGEISLEDYTKALKTATDEIEDLSTAITTTAIPAFRDMSGVVEQATDEMESEFYDTSEAIKKTTKDAEQAIEKSWDELHPYLSNLCTDLSNSFGNFAYGLMDKGSTLGENLKGLWADIGNSFKTMVADYVADQAKKLLLSVVTSTTEMATSVTSGLSAIGPAITGIATGIGTLITTLATAIATAATTLAAAAPALMVVLGIALAAYAGFKLIGALFGKKGGGDLGYTNTLLEEINWIQLGAINLKLDVVNQNLAGMHPKFNTMLNQFYRIRDATEGTLKALTSAGTVYVDVFRSAVMERLGQKTDDLGNKISSGLGSLGNKFSTNIDSLGNKFSSGLKDGLKQVGDKIGGIKFDTGGIIKAIREKDKPLSAQFGAILTQPGLVETHGTPAEPEYIIPSRGIEKFVPSTKTSTTKIVEVKMDLQQTFFFNNQVDPNFTKKYVLNEIIPIMYQGIETGARKTRLKEIIGVA